MTGLPHRANGAVGFRGIQLDLARQPETLDYIRSFTDFVSRHGFNHLVLYLEGRIRTKSFPFRKARESYTPDDMRRIVDYAGKKKVEVVPVVSMLGHAEQFLECPELEHLAELRGGGEGRFSKFRHVFCPSLKETREFLESYLTEIARLFPSEYFHAGFDEAWDIGFCDLCKKRLETGTQSDIFTQHLLDCHDIVAKKLKKRMIVWDDMFDMYPDALERIPKDIIMCAWHYDQLVDKPAGNFGGPKADKFALYDKLGLPYMFAPATSLIRNIETLSSYALKRSPLGALLTVWELKRQFLFSDYPAIAYAGALWSGSAATASQEELQESAVREVTGCRKKEQVAVIRRILDSSVINPPVKARTYLRGPLSAREHDNKLWLAVAAATLESCCAGAEETQHADVLEEMAMRVELGLAYFRLRELIAPLYSLSISRGEKRGLKKQIALCVERLESIKTRRRKQWNRHRRGIKPCHTDRYLSSLVKMLADAQAEATRTTGFLRATFPFNTPDAEFFIRYKGGADWRKVASGALRSPFPEEFQYSFPLFEKGVPEAVRIESWGYVGLRISYLEVQARKGRFVPASFGAVDGPVRDPEALLEESWDWCLLGEGEQAVMKKFLNPPLAKIRNAMEIYLRKSGW